MSELVDGLPGRGVDAPSLQQLSKLLGMSVRKLVHERGELGLDMLVRDVGVIVGVHAITGELADRRGKS